VCEQFEMLERSVLELTCRMSSFDIFYKYIIWFMAMLKKGEIAQRINKKQMHIFMSDVQPHSEATAS
jgi:hypothetical protein